MSQVVSAVENPVLSVVCDELEPRTRVIYVSALLAWVIGPVEQPADYEHQNCQVHLHNPTSGNSTAGGLCR